MHVHSQKSYTIIIVHKYLLKITKTPATKYRTNAPTYVHEYDFFLIIFVFNSK